MCIAVCGYKCLKEYPLILISNRDEFFIRKTALAQEQQAVLPALAEGLDEEGKETIIAPRDLARPDGGTWIGCNEATGAVCCLVNYKEPAMTLSPISRGKLPWIFLQKSNDDFQEYYTKNCNDIGGFIFLYGNLKKSNNSNNNNDEKTELSVVSNRCEGKAVKEGEIFAMSNSKVLEPWPKVRKAEQLLSDLISNLEHQEAPVIQEEQLVEKLFDILSTNDMDPTRLATMDDLPNSIFIPPIKCQKKDNIFFGNYYGTRTQTIILCNGQGKVTYLEKTLYDDDTLIRKDTVNRFEFDL